ncbi:hypothetical protein [Pontibacter virosus]|uniref:DUF4251 domain-containing protein n=1 Tax=Pontibacter virosus TaxID=1765052 RepID=A0A2U1APF5_9BACT|nr:hypothetical protein [Pontibacter virosus]PVY38207.1 hypothetical protein C8E01_11854 [Pontibacter virosus]
MKSILLVYLFVVSTLVSSAQANEGNEIYSEALNQYTLQLDSLYAGNRNHEGNTIYLEIPDFVNGIPNMVNGYQITVLTRENIKQVYKANNNSLIHTKLFPMKVEGGRMVVSFIPYSGLRKWNGNLHLSLGSGVQIHFKYDCQKESFEYERVVSWGI